MNYEKLIAEITSFLTNYIGRQARECDKYCFHDRSHAEDVVTAVEEMASYYKLGDHDRFIVVCAAYFHDIGYLAGGGQGHEQRSADIAVDFLRQNAVAEDVIAQIQRCILATKMPQNPQNLLEEIVCDADLFHFGGDNFQERNKLMRKEMECVKGHAIDKDLWRNETIRLLENHRYHTSFAREQRNASKADNLRQMKERQLQMAQKESPVSKKVKKDNRPERGIETMFRITSSNNQRLSDMADNKANILLTVNSIILSVVVAGLFRKLDNNVHLIIPTFILITSVVLTMVLAILSTIPKIPCGKFREEEIVDKSANLLFFGNFYKMPLHTYKESMKKVMEDADFLYGMMTKDVYSQGVVLGRKYRLLRYAYGIFMFGLILSVITFFINIIKY